MNNESSEIIRFLNSSFRKLAEPVDVDIYPEPLRKEIDDFHSWVYDTVNSESIACLGFKVLTPAISDGVYKCGFATTQEAYEAAVGPLFASLDRLEKMIKGKDYFFGDRLTEADIRLYTTIVRSSWSSAASILSTRCRFDLIRCTMVISSATLDPSDTTTPRSTAG